MRQCIGVFLLIFIALAACNGNAQELVLANNGTSDYVIITPRNPTKLELRSAQVLQRYLKQSTGAQIEITDENSARGKMAGIYIGNTAKAERISPGKRKPESYLIKTTGKDLVICGGSGRGLIYGTYAFLEKYMHCRKLSAEEAIVPGSRQLKIDGNVNDEYQPPFIYRECYYPAAHDAEYLEWHQLQQLDDLWGVWGHSFNKLVPAQTYFKTNPEYFALVKGKRQATQLCLSNEQVYKIVVAELKKRIADNPDALYWSVSPNDDNGYCTCDKCRAVDNEEGSPSGSLIKFVNRVAEKFPDVKITTLAYGYTHKAPRTLKPAGNVYVFLSDIDAFRDKPLATEGSAAAFRNDLNAWRALTPNIFIWDYVTQFTNYLAPFPNFNTLQPNMQFFKDNGVKGIFTQGSGDTYGEWAELRSYIIAKLYQNDKADVKQLISSFIKDYYGKAAPYLQQYIDLVQDKMTASHRKLDIYGNPVNEWKTWLTPELLEQYSNLLDKAEGAVEADQKYADRVMRARLPLEYTVLQMARFYGIEKHGIFVKEGSKWVAKPKMQASTERFVKNCKKAGVTELSEAGPAIKPEEYLAEWNSIFKMGVIPTKALDAKVTLQYPFAEDYPAKGNRTLVDGNPGYGDFSYNWLCFYGTPMIATINLGKTQNVSNVEVHFLDDPRHWIFLPERFVVDISEDGVNFKPAGDNNLPSLEEHYEVHVNRTSIPVNSKKVRYIRVTANNRKMLPDWRYRDNKKPMIACSEIYVQ